MEYKIDEIVTLPPYDIKARVVAVKKEDCSGCYYHYREYACVRYMDDGSLGRCSCISRGDHKSIIYKPLSEEEKEI